MKDKEIDEIYDKIDELLKDSNFFTVNEFLGGINITILNIDYILTILTATLAAKSKLPNREIFLLKAKNFFKNDILFKDLE